MPTNRRPAILMPIVSVVLLCGMPLFAGDNSPAPELARAGAFAAGRVSQARGQYGFRFAQQVRPVPKQRVGGVAEPRADAPSSEFSLVYQVLGVGNGFPGYTVSSDPPNPTLAVGGTEVIQSANGAYADFDKSTGGIIPLSGEDFTLGNTIFRSPSARDLMRK